ncbi:MAG: hypothetical protein JWM34_4330 [Ilumatobacteraceae bacterium]|nr:hypothetical protein [Ilumatobacteraceae bacterium]
MLIDDKRLNELIEESQDQHTDAIKQVSTVIPDLRDHAADRRRSGGAIITPDEIRALEESRSNLRAKLMGVAGIGVVGAAVGTILARPVAADTSLDIQMLQTNASLEILAVATYGAAIGLDFIANGNPVILKFAQTTMKQHDDHDDAFNAQAKALGGAEQTMPNPKYAPIVEAAKPTLKAPLDVVNLAMTLETVATNTYLNECNMFSDKTAVALLASIMGVECQHLATLRAVAALLSGGADALIAIPTDVTKLPAAAGNVSFPDAFEPTTMASPADEGAVK